MNKISVVLIEDHHLTRSGIKAALEDCEQIEFIGEAANGLQGLTLLENNPPDVAIVDIGLPGLVVTCRRNWPVWPTLRSKNRWPTLRSFKGRKMT